MAESEGGTALVFLLDGENRIVALALVEKKRTEKGKFESFK
jgi:hypothetical protein